LRVLVDGALSTLYLCCGLMIIVSKLCSGFVTRMLDIDILNGCSCQCKRFVSTSGLKMSIVYGSWINSE